MKKILILLLLAAILITTLFACSNGSSSTDYTTTSLSEPDVTTQPDSSVEIILLSGYTLIRPDPSSHDIISKAVLLTKALTEVTGETYTLTDDWIGRDEVLPEKATEILIGNTNRTETQTVLSELGETEFAVRFFDDSGRIVICGKTDELTIEALDYFIQAYISNAEGPVSVPSDLNFVFDTAGVITNCTINGVNISNYSIVIPSSMDNDDRYSAILLQRTIKEKTGYNLKMVKDADFTSEYGFLIGKTSLTNEEFTALDNSDKGYAIGTQGNHIVLYGYGGMTVKATKALLSQLFSDKYAGAVSASVDEAKIICPEKQVLPDISEQIGKYPVVLTDKPNSCISVYDLSPVITGGEPKKTWSFVPKTTSGFSSSAYGTENRIRYSELKGTYIFGFVASSGYAALATYPEGKCVWEATDLKGNSPHSIEYLPNGTVAVACSGGGDETKSFVFLYTTLNGKKSSKRFASDLDGAHALLWDDIREVLWALGNTDIVAYEVGEDPYSPTLTEIACYECTTVKGGHDMSIVYGTDNMLWISGSQVWQFDRSTGELSIRYRYRNQLSAGNVKGICSFRDGVVVRTRQTISGTYSTDRLLVCGLGDVEAQDVIFPGNQFYKARVFVPEYH